MKLSIVIPTYNRPAMVIRVLEILEPQAQKYLGQLEIVVVDDASTPENFRFLSDFVSAVNLKLVKNEVNLGPSEARNRGLHECSGESVAFLDDDVLPSSDYIDQTLNFLTGHPEIMVAVGHLEPFNSDIYARFWKECYDSVFGRPPGGEKLYCVPMFSTGLGFVRREILERSEFQPLFAPHLQTCEDYDLFVRLQTHNIEVWKCEQILAYNQTRTDLGSFLEQRYSYWKYASERRERTASKTWYRLSLPSHGLGLLGRIYIFYRAFRDWIGLGS